MIEIVSATWLALFMGGVFSQLIAPAIRGHKLANQYGAIMSVILLSVSALLVGYAFDGLTIPVILLATAYFLLNALVLWRWQFHPMRTRTQVLKNGLTISLTVLILGVLADLEVLGEAFAVLSLAGALYILGHTLARFNYSRDLPIELKGKHPTVTVAVPARNETHALTKQLESILDSSYDKLEILVLDDCSQDKTAELIKSFAHKGVRFIAGKIPEGSWIGKNYAYKQLAEEASGEIVIFSGVDTRYGKDTVTKIVAYLQDNKLDMVSVMPRHERLDWNSMIIQPFRYLIMSAFSSSRRPPVLSTVWAIRAKTLEKSGGLDAVEKAIVPEQHFASYANKKNRYSFLVGSYDLALTTYKKYSSQEETATRVLYPLLRRSVGNHFLFVAMVVILVWHPIIAIVQGLWLQWTASTSLSAVALCAMLVNYVFIVGRSYPWHSVWLWPLYYLAGSAAMLFLSVRSGVGYEADSIVWKGRNVCYPVMSVNPPRARKKRRKRRR